MGFGSSDRIYDDITYRWQDINDAPYELDMSELKSMQRMERALDFILQNLDDPDMTIDDCARAAGYNKEYFNRAFRDYFDVPFAKFVGKLRLRQAAREILNGYYEEAVSKKIGFLSIQSFSKAFRKEFGVSPRQFRTGGYDVPDMPLRRTIKGVEISLEYTKVTAFRMKGIKVDPPMGDDTFLMDQNAFVFNETFPKDEYPGLDLSPYTEKIGIWWYDQKMTYVFGPVTGRSGTVYMDPEDTAEKAPAGGSKNRWGLETTDLTIQGGDYAVFSYPRPADSTKIYRMSRILSRFVSREWIPMNRKIRNTMSCSYDAFDSNRVYLYIPLSGGMGISDELKPRRWSVQSWSRYIDENITEDLTLDSLALAAGYCARNYRDVFSMYYGMTPTEYISKRRLLLSYEELSAGEDEKAVMAKYHYKSKRQFDHEYEETFGKAPDGQPPAVDIQTDFMSFYETNIKNIRISICKENSRHILIHSIEETANKEIPDDLIGRMIYWFTHEFDDFKPIRNKFAEPEEKVFIWGSEPAYEDGKPIYKYYVGGVLNGYLGSESAPADTDPSIMREEDIPGGRYAVFSTQEKTDDKLPEDAARLLTRCAFGGYISKNRWRIDLTRRTFIIWRSNKLFFFVPIVR